MDQAIVLNEKIIPIFSNQTLVLQLHHKYNVVVVAEAQFQEPISSVVVKDSKSYCFIHHKAPAPVPAPFALRKPSHSIYVALSSTTTQTAAAAAGFKA